MRRWLCLTALVVSLMLPGVARAFTLDSLSADGFASLGAEIGFATEAKARTFGNWELGIWKDETTPAVQASYDAFAANNGIAFDFELDWDGSLLSYRVFSGANDPGTLLTTSFSGGIDSLFLRARAEYDSSMLLTGLSLNGEALGASLLADALDLNSGSIENFLGIYGIDGAFSLTGTSIMTWDGNAAPLNSRLAYQIKGGEMPVPEPATMLLLGGGALGLVPLARKRRKS